MQTRRKWHCASSRLLQKEFTFGQHDSTMGLRRRCASPQRFAICVSSFGTLLRIIRKRVAAFGVRKNRRRKSLFYRCFCGCSLDDELSMRKRLRKALRGCVEKCEDVNVDVSADCDNCIINGNGVLACIQREKHGRKKRLRSLRGVGVGEATYHNDVDASPKDCKLSCDEWSKRFLTDNDDDDDGCGVFRVCGYDRARSVKCCRCCGIGVENALSSGAVGKRILCGKVLNYKDVPNMPMLCKHLESVESSGQMCYMAAQCTPLHGGNCGMKRNFDNYRFGLVGRRERCVINCTSDRERIILGKLLRHERLSKLRRAVNKSSGGGDHCMSCEFKLDI